jgi:BarA-like signal transduction histidine kinase
MFNNFVSENRAIYEIMWRNIVQPDRTQMAIWHMRIAWIAKATNTHSDYVILIAFPRRQGLLRRACLTSIRVLPVMLICMNMNNFL